MMRSLLLPRGFAKPTSIGSRFVGRAFDGDGTWQVPLGAWVQVRGTIVERSDLPVFIADPNEPIMPIMPGMPVPPRSRSKSRRPGVART